MRVMQMKRNRLLKFILIICTILPLVYLIITSIKQDVWKESVVGRSLKIKQVRNNYYDQSLDLLLGMYFVFVIFWNLKNRKGCRPLTYARHFKVHKFGKRTRVMCEGGLSATRFLCGGIGCKINLV